ncbi:MAG: hypothetical protein E6J89_07060 [Deltaproteobacteria bacterium]|nr:MAG: hypothetical protein E6J89_07060 [Deltaproteobacteria bacterium]
MGKLSERYLMVNHIYGRRQSLLVLFFCILSFQGCANQSVLLVHPQSGATVRCNASGTGLMSGFAEGFVEECVTRYEKEGYLSPDKLTPEQRIDLEKRGVLPKPEPPTTRGEYM